MPGSIDRIIAMEKLESISHHGLVAGPPMGGRGGGAHQTKSSKQTLKKDSKMVTFGVSFVPCTNLCRYGVDQILPLGAGSEAGLLADEPDDEGKAPKTTPDMCLSLSSPDSPILVDQAQF